jgi:hypothetical protein
MRKFLFSRSFIGLGAAIATFAALPVGMSSAKAALSTSPCPGEQFTQPFLPFGDSGYYTLAPGESADNFDGTGWTLSGGASIVTTTLADGTTGQVLDLPAGSAAVSPTMCVSTGSQGGRMMTQVVAPAPGKGKLSPPKVTFTTTVLDGKGPGHHMELPGQDDWALSHNIPVAPGNAGTEQVQFAFSADDKSSELQVYNFYVDPRMLH